MSERSAEQPAWSRMSFGELAEPKGAGSGRNPGGHKSAARTPSAGRSGEQKHVLQPWRDGSSGEPAYAHGRNTRTEWLQRGGEHGLFSQNDGFAGELAEPNGGQRGWIAGGEGRERDGDIDRAGRAARHTVESAGETRSKRIDESGVSRRPGPVNGFWRAADWLYCRDDKWRPVEPGSFPLADGASRGVGRVRADQESIAARKDQGNRVGRLRGYGNAICAEAAVAFIETFGNYILDSLGRINGRIC